MVTILGAGGAIGSELVKELTARNESIRLVSRNPKLVPGAAEAVAADLSNLDDTVKAVTGSRIAKKFANSSRRPRSAPSSANAGPDSQPSASLNR
jgi:putative NADH-flavin reductase